jgi:hypothetical protein
MTVGRLVNSLVFPTTYAPIPFAFDLVLLEQTGGNQLVDHLLDVVFRERVSRENLHLHASGACGVNPTVVAEIPEPYEQ